MNTRKLVFACVFGLLVTLLVASPTLAGWIRPSYGQAPQTNSIGTCASCSECSTMLASGSYAVVRLTTDLINQGGSCVAIILGESNATFDCDGHVVDGDDIAIDPDYGIVMLHGSNNSVLNCTVSDFYGGIYIGDATNHTVTNSVMRSNGVGLKLQLAGGSTISGNTMEENYTGISFYMADGNTLTDNRVCNNIITDFDVASSCGNAGSANQCNIPDGWNDDSTTGCTYPCWTCWTHLPLIAR